MLVLQLGEPVANCCDLESSGMDDKQDLADEMVRQGKTIKEIARATNQTWWVTYGAVRARMRNERRQRRLGDDERTKIEAAIDSGENCASIAKRFGVHRSTVCRLAWKRPAPMVTLEKPLDFSKVPPYTCPGCGSSVSTTPCVICVARSYRADH